MEKLHEPIIVAVNHEPSGDNWVLTSLSAEILNVAARITDAEVVAVSIVPRPDLTALGNLGVSAVYVPDSVKGARSVPAFGADAMFEAIERIGSTVGAVLLPSNYWGKEIVARLAVRLGTGGAVDVTDIQIQDGRLIAKKTALGGSWVTRFTARGGIPVLSMTPSGTSSRTAVPCTPSVITLEVAPTPETAGVRIVSSRRDVGDTSESLAEADIAVVGGRGVDGDFDLVRDLAAELDGAVGATRVACDEGWIDRTAQIGQTGISISPKIYIGLGVSGAIHHTCGMQGSETIIAICDDPDAPIFEIADFGIVGDVTEVVPQAIESLQELREQ